MGEVLVQGHDVPDELIRECVTPDRPRTRQRIADRESCDSMQTMRCVPRKLTPYGADAGVPFDPGLFGLEVIQG